MTTPDERLAALFAADLPPARDPVFQAEVLAGLARRKLIQDLAWLSAVSALGAVALGVAWPALSPILAELGRGLAPAGLAAVVAAFIVAVAGWRWADVAS